MSIYRFYKKNPDEYNFPEKSNFLGWAWEFLRRNEEYQKDWRAELKAYLRSPRVIGRKYLNEVTGKMVRDSAFFPVKGKRLCLQNNQWEKHDELDNDK
ncbi:MAG: DUF6499 domain-containing protein [Pseudomonadota bacterium]